MVDLIDTLRTLAAKIPKLRSEGLIKTEEGTKNALVMPFINALGYDVFNPLEVTPELIADVGVKKGEKVDYAIRVDGKPAMLFECKMAGTNLKDVQASQLYRYFTTTEARFGILTDGITYRFYTDLDQSNIMDKDPFFVFDMMDIKEANVDQLKRFTKGVFDVNSIVTAASELKYKSLIKAFFVNQLSLPTEPFVRVCLQESNAYTGRITQTVIDQFAPLVRESMRLFVNDAVEQRLKSALAREEVPIPTAQPAQEDATQPATTDTQQAQAIITTQDEIEAYFTIKAILRDTLDVKRVVMRDAQSYCAILLDDNNRRTIARLRFGVSQKSIGILNEQRNEEKFIINSIDDIYGYADKLKAAVSIYLPKEA
jgi:predicted type IV restriction endonuclease